VPKGKPRQPRRSGNRAQVSDTADGFDEADKALELCARFGDGVDTFAFGSIDFRSGSRTINDAPGRSSTPQPVINSKDDRGSDCLLPYSSLERDFCRRRQTRKKRRWRRCLQAETRDWRPRRARNGRKNGLSDRELSVAGFGRLGGGRTRARTWDPLIESKVTDHAIQWADCKPIDFGSPSKTRSSAFLGRSA
jgi:hypothetical protein